MSCYGSKQSSVGSSERGWTPQGVSPQQLSSVAKIRAIVHGTPPFAVVERVLHSFHCSECRSLFAAVRLKGRSKHVSRVVATALLHPHALPISHPLQTPESGMGDPVSLESGLLSDIECPDVFAVLASCFSLRLWPFLSVFSEAF